METNKSNGRRRTNAIAWGKVLAVGLLLGASVATASVPAPDGTINGCYNARGNLRVVDEPADCSGGETPLAWNQAGPQGPEGAVGPAGPPGPQGSPGFLWSIMAFRHGSNFLGDEMMEIATQDIILDEPRRIHLDATVMIAGGSADMVACNLKYTESMGSFLFYQSAANGLATLSIAHNTEMPPGAHTVGVQCRAVSGDPTVEWAYVSGFVATV